MRLLLIHGRAQGGHDPALLKQAWLAALHEGCAAAGRPLPAVAAVDFPYYGDELDHWTARAKLPGAADVVAKGSGQNQAFESFMQSALDQLRVTAGLSDAEIDAELTPGAPIEKGVQNWAWVQALARVLDRRLTPLSDFTIETFLKDVYLYLSSKPVQRAIDGIVEAMLTDEPTLVIAHSLGTVVAYNVIRAHRQRLDLRKFITVGSPLGIRVISSRLGVVTNPAGQDGWFNAYDERDVVALNPLDQRNFPALPPILNYAGVRNQTDNRHGIAGYLNDPRVAGALA